MKKNTILCVDDEKVVLNSLKEQLRSSMGNEYNIEISESGEDALEIFQELISEEIEVPLVISDYIMPGMKGDELLKRVHLLYPKTITILLTGQATLEGVTSAINKANLYRYIPKPWEKDDLNLAVIEAVKSYKKDIKIESQNQKLLEQNQELLTWTDAFVETMSTTLDTRDTTTGGHSKRLAEYAVKTARAINKVNYGKYKDFKFSEEEIKELQYAALLHDIGKIGVREQILLKQQKLSTDRLLAIKYKFSLYKEILQRKLLNNNLSKEEIVIKDNISDYLNLIFKVSKNDFIDEKDLKVIKEIAKISFIDLDGEEIKLLDDFELNNLTTLKGNLTYEERLAINYHAELTFNILKGIPWPKHLEKIPEIAASHHEKLNGSGYYKGLKGDEISTQSRILAILDIFEALTSQDRPYKPAKSVQDTLKILVEEVERGSLDKDILDLFINEKVYE